MIETLEKGKLQRLQRLLFRLSHSTFFSALSNYFPWLFVIFVLSYIALFPCLSYLQYSNRL